MTSDTSVDWGQTRQALRNREAKATALARAAWDQGLDAADLADLDPAGLRRLARVAGVNPSKPGSETWTSVTALLVRMEAYAASNPGHAATVRADPARRVEFVPPAAAPAGWAELVALGPIPDALCQIGACRQPAVAVTTMRFGPARSRCGRHPPTGDDWGTRLNWAPTGCGKPGPCWCARCAVPGLTSTIPSHRNGAP